MARVTRIEGILEWDRSPEGLTIARDGGPLDGQRLHCHDGVRPDESVRLLLVSCWEDTGQASPPREFSVDAVDWPETLTYAEQGDRLKQLLREPQLSFVAWGDYRYVPLHECLTWHHNPVLGVDPW